MTRIPELQSELVKAAQRRYARPRVAALDGRRRAVALGVVVLLCLAAVGGAQVLDREAPSREAVDLYRPEGPVEFLSEFATGDGAPWVLRTWRRQDGVPCVQPGRRADDRFGLTFNANAGERFVPLAFHEGPACGPGAVQAVRLLDRLEGPGARPAATLLYGLLPQLDERAQAQVRVTVDDEPRPVAQSPQGTFLSVFSSDVPRSAIRATLSSPGNDQVLADFRADGERVPDLQIVNRQQVEGEALPWAQQAWRRDDGSSCAVSGHLMGGVVGRLEAGLPGAFVEEAAEGAYCGRVEDASDGELPATVHIRTQPAEPNARGARAVPGYLIVEGVVGERIAEIRVIDLDGGARPVPVDPELRLYLAVVPLELRDPYATELESRFAGQVVVEFVLTDARTVRRIVGRAP